MINVHEISSKLINITAGFKGYKEYLSHALGLLLKKEGGVWPWASFTYDMPEGGTRKYEYKTFRDYLKRWSQFTFEDLEKLFSDDVELLPLLRKADDRQGQRTDLLNLPDNIKEVKSDGGTGKAYTLSRLQDKFPELYEQVRDGKLSANRAAIEAGFRKQSTPLETMQRAWSKASERERTAFLQFIENQ